MLAAAIEVFGEKGPKGATVREIARVAAQNVAAIAYYFGSKEKLYSAVLEGIVREIRYQLREVLEEVQGLQNSPHRSRLEAARILKEFLQTIYLRLISRNEIAGVGRLIIREQLRPTAGVEVLYTQGFRGLHEALCFLVGVALGKDPESRETMVRTNLIMGQVYFFAMAREGRREELGGAIRSAVKQNAAVTANGVKVKSNGGWTTINLLVRPLDRFGGDAGRFWYAGNSAYTPGVAGLVSLTFYERPSLSMKKLIKDLVMSAAYRQDSHITPELLAKDPSNRLLARGPRVRLSFEQVRDQALAVSGLLSKKMYGKSVMPYQPQGIWNSVYSNEYWKESEGEDYYRRSVYTYVKRTSPYPSMMTFDGSSREVCVSRRIRTNTPLQALVTLNDSSFVVAGRNLATRMMKRGKNPSEQINAGYKLLVVRGMPVCLSLGLVKI